MCCSSLSTLSLLFCYIFNTIFYKTNNKVQVLTEDKAGPWQRCYPPPSLPLSHPLCFVLPRGYWPVTTLSALSPSPPLSPTLFCVTSGILLAVPRSWERTEKGHPTPPVSSHLSFHADGAKFQWLIMMAGRYKNQFETGTSGGALSSKARMRTEKVLFAGCYDKATGTQLHT